MSNDNGKPEQDDSADRSSEVKKPFGGIKPLTAIQIISLILPSSPVGATACY
ncbi:MAG: hypothetical protein H7336_07545 [Bacteriovorax sp.]|nr:hypothetical protein [Bacteriovorax sp.]